MEEKNYLVEKRERVLKEIRPICEAFNINEYDYEINELHEWLNADGTKICCDCNSIEATVQELVGFLFVHYWENRYFPSKQQTFNDIKRHWKK